MAKSVHDDVLDQSLNYVKTNGTRICVCSTQPTTYTEAITTYKLAIKTISSSDYTGPANGDSSGRKLTVNQAATITVDATGTASHVAIADATASKLLYVTTCSAQALTSGNTVTVPAWDIEIADPT
jgi:hypothetical protein